MTSDANEQGPDTEAVDQRRYLCKSQINRHPDLPISDIMSSNTAVGLPCKTHRMSATPEAVVKLIRCPSSIGCGQLKPRMDDAAWIAGSSMYGV